VALAVQVYKPLCGHAGEVEHLRPVAVSICSVNEWRSAMLLWPVGGIEHFA
jgi:hypothetical protein